MATITLTDQTFEAAVAERSILLVDFWAAWCGPCRQFAPVYEQASERHPDVIFAKVDTEAEHKIAAAAQITSIPTLMVFREGVLVFSQPGALPATALDDLIGQVKDLDMEEVHAQVARQRDLRDAPLEIGAADFAAAWTPEARVLDVREPSEYQAGHVPGAQLIPLGELPDRFEEATGDGPLYVICASGNRSRGAAEALRRTGIEAYSVAGGTSAWAAAGREIVTGAAATTSSRHTARGLDS